MRLLIGPALSPAGGVARLLFALLLLPSALSAQATVIGRVTEAGTGRPLAGASVMVEGTSLGALSDSTGRFFIARVPQGSQVLVTQLIGFARARAPLTVPARGVVTRDIQLAQSALDLPGLTVTADPAGRAEGELGTASVIDRAAIEHQTATSLAGVLELLPGVPLRPPGLAGMQQFGLRSVPTSGSASVTVGGPSPADLASFGTLIILDGVPLSNNANLQTTGPRGELSVPSSAGGGIDLRRLPASTIERVEVIRGVPSARYGDLTQGAVVVETRAGEVQPTLMARYDARTAESSVAGGRRMGRPGTVSGTLDAARTRINPGISNDEAYRFSAQLAHRATLGGPAVADSAGVLIDSRLDLYQLVQDSPEDPEVVPGRASWNRDSGIRFSARGRAAVGERSALSLILSLDHQRQRSMVQSLLISGATPFTERLEEGRAVGRFIGGEYLGRVDVHGDVWSIYSRVEADRPFTALGGEHDVRLGAELRREWNAGSGYQFDIARPPQVRSNGVRGFDRPRPFDAVPPLATTALYLDDLFYRPLPGDFGLQLQAGARLDLLHEGSTWFSGPRDAALQHRVNAQLTPPWPWLRLRAAHGTTAKTPPLSMLHPAPQYFDLVNVNWYTPDPAERLAVLTTFIRDPTNPDLGFSRGRKMEAGVELVAGRDASLSIVAFSDRTTGAVGIRPDPDFLLRDRYALADSAPGSGRPPTIVEPPVGADTIPIVRDVPDHVLSLEGRGWEATARFPEVPLIRTRLELQGALVRTETEEGMVDFGEIFAEFQRNPSLVRSPYWEGVRRTGERGLMTYRLVHHQPQLGLVVSAVVQHTVLERRQNIAGTDTLAFAGYVTRTGELVPVPAEERTRPEYADLRKPRLNTFVSLTDTPSDWLMSLQVSASLPSDAQLSFFAFNVLDRMGRLPTVSTLGRQYPPARFGLDLTIPLGGRSGS